MLSLGLGTVHRSVSPAAPCPSMYQHLKAKAGNYAASIPLSQNRTGKASVTTARTLIKTETYQQGAGFGGQLQRKQEEWAGRSSCISESADFSVACDGIIGEKTWAKGERETYQIAAAQRLAFSCNALWVVWSKGVAQLQQSWSAVEAVQSGDESVEDL